MSTAGTSPNTPVLVGVASVQQRSEEPGSGVEAIDLMEQALTGAATDAGAPGLLDRLGWLAVPDGNWDYADPAGLLASRVGASPHTVLGEVGILQQELFDRAIEAVSTGGADVAAVVGGEAKFRERTAEVAGVAATETDQGDVLPAETLVTPDLGLSDLEMERMLWNAVSLFAMIDNARRYSAGLPIGEHRDRIAALWERMGAIAAANPDAWDRSAPSATQIRDVGGDNRMLSFPYTKLLSSQWNVDQAGALVLCSAEVAESLGISRDRWVFPHASSVSNHAVAVEARAEPGRSPGAERAGPAVLETAGMAIDDIAHIDLYSCFPAAVQVYRDALGIAGDRDLSVTGGMTFGGGPFNNYVVQAMVTLARRLRGEPASAGLSSSVSGFLVKQGFGIWSATPPTAPWRSVDVTAEVAERDRPLVVERELSGPAHIVTYTVEHAGGSPTRLIAVCETPDGGRTLGEMSDAEAMADAMVDEWVGRAVVLDDSRIVP